MFYKGVNKSQLPVLYYSHSKFWMTGAMIDYLLSQINRKLRGNSHSVLMLMNNTGCHLENLIQKYTNIKSPNLPSNTTILHPLDLGVIQNVKTYYQKLLFQFVLARVKIALLLLR